MNTMQQEFDAVCEHLIKQGKQAFDVEARMCVYRGEHGAACAVGCRIPDRVYTPDMEDKGVYLLVEEHGHVLPPEIAEYEDMFSDLQDAHDNYYRGDTNRLKERLKATASMYGLTPPTCITN